MNAEVTTERLTKEYGDRAVVDDLDLEIREGSIFCLLGPNGSGKTTTVAMLTTMRRPTSGAATVCGYSLSAEPAQVRSVVGVALQHTGVDDLMSGREMLALQATLQGLRGSDAKHRVSDLIDLLDLSSHIDTRMGTWSGGLRRRIDLAAALVHRPRLLFLDEPTTGLDPASRRAIWQEIRRLSGEGVTVFLTTQYLDEADELADEVGILRDGELVITATPRELKDGLGDRTFVLELADRTMAERAQAVVGGSVGPDESAELRVVVDQRGGAECFTMLTAAGLEVKHISISEPTLEDVFLRLTAA